MGEPAGHYVICAYGRVGRAVMEELRRRDYTAVVIESKPELESLVEEHGVLRHNSPRLARLLLDEFLLNHSRD